MQSDKELLMLAAKAGGHVDAKWSDGCDEVVIPYEDKALHRRSTDWRIWNPLTDDGDALRLAVKLGIRIEQDWFAGEQFQSNNGRARAYTSYSLELTKSYDAQPTWFKEDFNGDPHAATRRAITRAAAQLAQAAQSVATQAKEQ